MYDNDSRGMALIGVLIFTLLGMIATAAIMSFLASGHRLFSVERRYLSALDAAKGAQEVVTKWIYKEELTCGSGCSLCDDTTEAVNICMGDYACIGPSGNCTYGINAILLAKIGPVYAVQIEAQKQDNSLETSIIQFVYRVPE